MRAQTISPGPLISKYVERILVLEEDNFPVPFVLPLYANGVPNLLFNTVKGKLGNRDSAHLTLFGQTISPESLSLDKDFTLIAYFFKPHSLVSLFGIQAFELTDKPIDLYLLFPKKTISLQEKLLNCEKLHDMICALDQFIFELICLSNSISDTVVYAAEKIAQQYTKESLGMLQRELNVTERTLQRMFEKNIGISPNQYRRICQFNSAFTDLNMRRFNHLTDIAYKHSYADQSHYIRAFREFTGLNPGEYLKYGADV